MINRFLVTCMLYSFSVDLLAPLFKTMVQAMFGIKLVIDVWIKTNMEMLCAITSIFFMYNSLEIIHGFFFIVDTLDHSQMANSNILDFKSCINDIPDTTVDPHQIKTAVSKCLVKSAV